VNKFLKENRRLKFARQSVLSKCLMDDLLTEFQSKFFIGFLLAFTNIFLHLAKMAETATIEQQTVFDQVHQQHETDIDESFDDQHENEHENEQNQHDDQPKATAVEKFENIDLEFDCPESIEFKDPNVEDRNRKNQENLTERRKPQLARNTTRTKLYKTVEKIRLSPITKKKKQFKPVTYNNKRPIINVNERLYNAALRRQPVYKTLAELVQEFDKKTRVYEDVNDTKFNDIRKNNLIHPKSPKLLSKNRNRPRTALSQLEQDELIARTIKKNTFKAQPINKKIFDDYATGIPKVPFPKKSAVKNPEIGLHSTRRFEMRREKMQAIQKSIENVNFVFKARPMPIFKKVPIMMRNNQLIKKQSSESCLNINKDKMISTIVKQTSDSTLTRIAHNDLIDCDSNHEDETKNTSPVKTILVKLSTETEDETSICEFKSLINFENSYEEDGLVNLNNNDKEN